MKYTEENNKLEIIKFKEEQSLVIENMITEQGYLAPIVTILVFHKDKSIYHKAIVEVPPELLESEKGKDVFVMLAPSILKQVSEEGMIPVCFSWSCEAWIRKSSMEGKTKEEVLVNWRDLPKEEGLITYFESAKNMSIKAKKIIREGKRIDIHGNLIDNIILESDVESEDNKDGENELEGRFTHIFEKYQQNI